MGNKILRYCIVESECRVRIIALTALAIIMIGQLWYRGVQVERVRVFQKEKVFVERLGDMEEILNTRAQLAAFRKEENIDLTNVRPTKISGIAMQRGVPSVLVDGTVYSEGSSFGEYVIVKITKEIITLVNKRTNAIKNLYVFE